MTAQPPPKLTRARRRRGVALLDTAIGLGIVATLGLVLVITITHATRARERLDDQAAAVRVARQVMATIRQGGQPPATIDDASVEVRPATADDGRKWVDVTVTLRGQTATLTGLAQPAGGGK